ncbi:MAG TPA: S-layer homology domain-containing protein [Tissierellaceae bacterium]
MRKTISLILAFVLTFSIFINTWNVYADDLYEEAGNILKELGVLKGDEKGNLQLNNYFTREQMVVMMSRLFNEENNAKSFNDPKTPNTFKDLTGQNESVKFYTPYIRWAVSKGLIKGFEDGTFGFGKNVTVQQYQAVLLRALKYTEEADDWNNVPQHAEKYNLMKGLSLSPTQYLTRGQMAVMTLNALQQEINRGLITLAEWLEISLPKPFEIEATVKVENNTATFTGQAKGTENLFLHLKPASSSITTGDQIFNIILDKDGKFTYTVKNLQVGNYQYRFQSGTNYTDYKLFTIKTLPFAVVDVKASNLKEITLTFTKPVDKEFNSIIGNYNTTAGSIKDIRFYDDNTIVLILNGTMNEGMTYKISASRIKADSGEEIQLNNYEFEAVDKEAPKITSVKQLGTKGLKVYLSEPVKDAYIGNFKVDGKTFPGTVDLNYNIVTLTYFSSSYTLSEGTHTLTVSDLEDFAGNITEDEDFSFKIVKDTKAPYIVDATATLEEVIIEFSEEIDPEVSEDTRNFYWIDRNVARYPDKVTIEENKAMLEFTKYRLTQDEYTTIYVEHIADYSGNYLKSDEIDVLPEIDSSKPEVVNYTVSEDGKTITIYFSKNVYGNQKYYYSIVDESNRPITILDIQGSGKEYKIILSSALPAGLNTLTIEGIQDTTPLRNTMKPFTATINMRDIEKPKLVNFTGYGNRIIVYFSKPMDVKTVSNYANYIMTYNGKQLRIPSYTIFTLSNDNKTLTITLPEYYTDGNKIMVGAEGNLTALSIIGLKDTSGNDTDPLIIDITFDSNVSESAKAVDYYKDKPGYEGILIETNIIKVRFSMPIKSASIRDFSILGRTIYDVVADGTDEVTIYLDPVEGDYTIPSFLTISPNNKIKTIIDAPVEGGLVHLLDRIPPKVISTNQLLKVSGNVIEVPFTKELEEEGVSLYRRDIEIIRLADNKILSKDDYTTSLKSTDKSVLLITIKRPEITSKYSIKLVGENNSDHLFYIRDISGNLALPSGIYYTEKEIPKN